MLHTHALTFDGDVLTKRYRSWNRGEHEREWEVLTVLYPHMPGLVPKPLAHGLADDPPWLSMSRLPGTPLGAPVDGEPMTAAQLDALAVALRRMWTVPAGGLPLRRLHPLQARSVVLTGLETMERPQGIVGDAYDICVEFLSGPCAEPVEATIVGHADANLANYLWDGSTVRIVDFEDAGRSDPAYALGFLVEHLSSRATDWTGFLRRFDVDSERLRKARLLSAAHWLYLLRPGSFGDRINPPGTFQTQARRILRTAAL